MVKMRDILRLEAESRHKATCVTKPNHPRTANAALRVSILIHQVPTDDHGTGGKTAHGDEAYPKVLRVEVVMNS